MRVLFYLLMYLFIANCATSLVAQEASISNSIKDIIKSSNYNNNQYLDFSSDPVNTWPACSEPKGIVVSFDNENLSISWDKHLDSKTNIEYEVNLKAANNSGKSIKNSIIKTNKFEIEYTSLEGVFEFSFNVRRVCKIAGKEVYSKWVVEEISIKSDTQLSTSDPCEDILNMISFINNPPDTTINDTLLLTNNDYDFIEVVFSGRHWVWDNRNGGTFDLLPFTKLLRVNKLKSIKVPFAQGYGLIYAVKKVKLFANEVDDPCLTTHLVDPKTFGCDSDAIISYTVDHTSTGNNISLSILEGDDDVSATIYTSSGSYNTINGVVNFSTCDNFNIKLTVVKLVNGIPITSICDAINIENICPCANFRPSLGSDDLAVIHPSCTTTSGGIFVNVTGYISSIGEEFSDTHYYQNLAPGAYYIQFKSLANGCLTVPLLVIINQIPAMPDTPVFGVNQQSGCNNQKGIISVQSPIGGHQYGYNSSSFSNNTIFQNLLPGTYIPKVKNIYGCISYGSPVTINSFPSSPTSPSVTITNPTCNAGTNTGTFYVTFPTGSQYTYSIDGINFQSSNVFSNVLPGTYTVTVKDINSNCSSSVGNKTVTPIPTPGVPTASVTTQPSCTLTTGTITITSPTGSQYRYSINGSTYSTSMTYSNLSPGVYNVTVKNTSTNCVSSPRQLTVNAILPSAAVTVQPTCNAPNGTIMFSGPTGSNIRYSINDGASYSTSVSFLNLSPGTYLCKFRNTSTGCTSNALSIVVNPVPTFTEPSVSITQPNCQDLFGIVSVTSPTGANFQYSLDGGAYQTSINFYNLVPGFHTLIAKNTTDNCLSNPTHFIINDESMFSAKPVVVVNDPTCEIQSGTINIQSPIGNDFEYTVNNVNYFSNQVFQNLAPGNYTIKARSKSTGCISEGTTISISSIPSPPSNGPSIITTQLNCFSNTGSVNITAPVGDKIFYSLNNGEIQSASNFSGLVPGVYTIKSLDATSFCYSPATSFEILPFDNGTSQELNFDFFDQIDCETEGGNITILSPLGSEYEYSINNGPFQSSPNFINLPESSYNIKYKNLNSGCLSEDSECTINTISCTPNPELICDILSSFDAIVQSENTISIVAPNDFLDVLALNNTSNNDIDYQYSLISSIKFALDYTDNGTPKTLENEIYNSQMYPSFSDFDISSWSIILEGVNTDLFVGQYTITILMKDGSTHICDPVTLDLIDETITEEENTNSFPDLPVLDCTTELLIKDTSNQVPNDSLKIGDIIFIQAFPIQVTDFDAEAQQGRYSGVGILPIPFGSKNVLVEFNNVFINIKNVITDGIVSVVRTEPTPTIVNAPPLVIGGDICIPPPPPSSSTGGINAYGFDPATGLHTNGTAYDDNNFDINGNYKDSDPPSPYNPNGCTRDGWSNDAPPKRCDPSIDPSGPIPAVATFLEQNNAQINTDIIRILNAIKTEATNKLAALGCNEIRDEVISLNTDLEYEECFTIGQDNKYVHNPDILQHFKEPLKKREYESSLKNINTEELETKHVDFYECILKSKKNQLIIDKINEILNDPEKLAEIQSSTKAKIALWSEEEAAKYIGEANQAAFDEWLTKELKEYLIVYTNNPDLFSFFQKKPYRIQPIKHEVDYIDYYGSMAAINSVFPQMERNEREELEYLMKQDFQTIKGIDRAFYLEAMSKSINLNDVPNNVYTLPLSQERQVGSLLLTLILDNVSFNQTTGLLDAYVVVEDPESGRKLVFKGLQLTFNTNGPSGNNKVSLGNDVELRLNNAAKLILKGNQDTYVQFNCDGFNGMGIDADVEFCRNFIIPLNNNLTPIAEPARYSLNLKTTMTKWLDFSFTANASPFALAKYEDIKFELTNMVLDMSSTYSPPITFPDGYQNPVASTPSWRGFYIQNLSVTFPHEFSSNNTPAKAAINNFVIDGTGVSGEGSYTGQILSLENGSIGGWGMSIGELGVKFLHNHFASFTLKGEIEVPIFNEPFDYIGHVYPNKNYKFTVLPKTNLSCDLFVADAELTSGSGITIGHDDLGFHVTALLNGKLKIKNGESMPIDLPEINFEGVKIGNRAPYFSPGNWPIPKDIGFEYAGFELNLYEAKLYKPDTLNPKSIGLYLNVGMAFEGNFSIALRGGLGITGELKETSGKQKWEYKSLKVHDFCLGGSFPGVDKIAGCLIFYDNDPDYGKGFKGAIYVSFSGFLKELKAIGQFGKLNGESYFFVDASASLQKSIPLFAGIELKGFSGGVSYGMSSTFDPDNLNFAEPAEDFDNYTITLGVGFSGKTYTVDNSAGLGLKAGAMFNMVGQDEIFNGSLEISITFNDGGGLKHASLLGLGQFLSPMNLDLPIKNPISGQQVAPVEVTSVLSAYVFLEWVPGRISGTVEAFLNAGPLRGRQAGGKMVNIDLEFTKTNWHIYMGHPDKEKRCGVDLNLEIFTFKFDSYLCMGTKIPDMPDIPDNVKSILPKIQSNSGLRGGGGGIVFGASFSAGVELDLIGIITAKGEIGAGFDVMLRKFKNMTCAGGNGSPIGFNGWYGAGQVYAYVTGELKLFGFNVIKAGVAAALQARLPNPTWVQGTAGIYLDTWLYKGKFDLAISVGETCTFISTNPNNQLGIEVIASTNPIDSSEEVNVDINPKIEFNLPINRSLKIKDITGVEKYYTAKLKDIFWTTGSDSTKVDFKQIWENNESVVNLRPKYLLSAYQTNKITIFVDVFENQNKLVTEKREINFTTGEELSNISESLISSTYPVNKMQNFYKDEVQLEYIELNQGLYSTLKDVNYNIFVKLDDDIYLPCTISDEASKIEFDITPYLQTETKYKLELVRIPKVNDYAKMTKDSEESVEKVLYTINFRTSKYNKFADRVTNLSPLVQNPNIGNYRITDEPFDELEYKGNTKYGKLIIVNTEYNPSLFYYIDPILKHGYSDDLIKENLHINSQIWLNAPHPFFSLGYLGSDMSYSSDSQINRVYFKYHAAISYFYDKVAEQVSGIYDRLIESGLSPEDIPENEFYKLRIAPKPGGSNPIYFLTYRLPNGKFVSNQEIK